MPLYDYVCQKCGHKTEVLQRHGDRPLKSCPECGGKVKKAFSAPAIQFKGSGFYLTDYGKSGGPDSKTKSDTGEKSESKPTDSSSSSSSSDSGKSDAKPAVASKSESVKSEASKPDTKKKAAKKGE